jgi:CrcB protein
VLDCLAISPGAIVGANARYWMSRSAVRLLGPVFPYRTLAINVLGSFALGFFLVWTSNRGMVDPRWRLLIAVGFCGGFTTFSSYAFESMALMEQGQWLLVATNIASNSLLSLTAVLAGRALARLL